MSGSADRIIRPVATPGLPGSWCRKWRLMAWVVSTLDLPDGKDNAEYFGYPGPGRGDTALPQARVLSLAETGTRGITAAAVGPCSRGEQDMAKEIIGGGKLTAGMLLLSDSDSYGYKLWETARSAGAKLLWRAKSGLRLPVAKRLDDGSYLRHCARHPEQNREQTARGEGHGISDPR
jgi:hypothetical protein